MKRKSQIQQVKDARKKPHHDSAMEHDSPAFELKNSKSTRELAEPYRLATVKFPIDALSPIWTVGINRPINESHKRKLCAIFEVQGLHRHDVDNRLRVACSREDVEKMKEAMGSVNHEEDVSFQSGSMQTEKPAWPCFKDWTRVIGKKAELMGGHHRVEALKEMLNKSGGGEDERWWLCELYDKGIASPPQPLETPDISNRD